jgi:hypothetical protein
MENEENPKQVFHRFPPPLEIALRDSHIPAAPAATAWKSGNPKARLPLSHSGLCFPLQTQKGGFP